MLFKMAWRNLWRHKRRSFITCFSVAFGYFLALSLTGMAEDSYQRTVDVGAKMGMGHITVLPPEYLERPAVGKRVAQADALREQVAARPEVRSASSRILGQAMFANGGRTQGGQFVAVDPGKDNANFFAEHLVEGALFEGANERGALVGHKMATRLRLKLGRKLIYTTTNVNGEIVSDMVRVTGIFDSGVDDVDATMVLLPIGRARATLGYEPGESTMVAVLLHDQRQVPAQTKALEQVLGQRRAEVVGWRQTLADLAGFMAVDRATNRLFQLLVALLIAAGVLNTLYMSVMERRREFGVMMAVGMKPGSLFGLVLAESALIGVVGVLMGAVLMVPWHAYMTSTGIDMSAAMEGYELGGVAVDPIIRLFLSLELVLGVTATLFALTLASGLYPAWVAGRIPPVESLRTI